MMIKEDDLNFIKDHLNRFGNCACGRRIIKQYSSKTVLEALAQEGYYCKFEIITDDGKAIKNIKYPTNATYVLFCLNSKGRKDNERTY